MSETQEQQSRAVPYYVIESAMEQAKDGDKYAVCRSDGDVNYARTHQAARQLRIELFTEDRALSPVYHDVVIVALDEGEP